MNKRYSLPVSLLVIVIAAAAIAVAGWLLYRSQREICRAKAESLLTSITDLKVNGLFMWRKERLADAQVFYKNKPFTDLVRRCVERPQDLALQDDLRTWISHFQTSQYYDRIVLFNAAGEKWMMFSNMKKPVPTMTARAVRDALHSGQLAFTDFYRTEQNQGVALRIFVPILNEQGAPLAALMLRIDAKVEIDPVLQDLPTPSHSTETILIRREDDEAVVLNELRFQKNTALNRRVSLDKTEIPVVKAALGQDGIVEGADEEGVPVLAAIRAVPDSPWVLVTQIDLSEVYAPMREKIWLVVLFLCTLLFGVAVAVVVLHRVFAFAMGRLRDRVAL